MTYPPTRPTPPIANPARPTVHGQQLDQQTRCKHYFSFVDVIAIRMHCCRTYYACRQCHDEVADHKATCWPQHSHDEPAILCGVCAHVLTINQYLSAQHQCPRCQHAFNPLCANHYDLYFEMPLSF